MTHETPALAEAERLMNLCNSCRYCEGLCAVFPAMEMRRTFGDADLNYLANLCHSCSACYHDCQFSPPHEFDVNVPRVLAQVRNDSYAHYAWPAVMRPLFRRGGLVVALGIAVTAALFLIGFIIWNDPGALFNAHMQPGNFYALMPHSAMVALFGAAFLYMLVATGLGAWAFWRDSGATGVTVQDAGQAGQDALSLRYLDGGGIGCMNEDELPEDNRRLWHHLTFYGFLLCFASTSVATLYHYGLGRAAPYAWWDVPPLLGLAGGVGLVVGPIGLWRAKSRRDPMVMDDGWAGMEAGFLAILFLTGATGLGLLFLRATPLMGVMLALHLGCVLTFFLTMPYGKFVHGIYRGLALLRYARDRRDA